MQSLFAQLFLALQAHIKANVPAIRFIDQDLGQLEYYDNNGRPAVSWPCVLIDFESNTSDHHQGVQWVELSVLIRLALNPYSSASSLSPDFSKEKALRFYELERDLYIALQNFDADGLVQPMTRTGAQTEKREDPIRVRVITFTTATEDGDAADYSNRVKLPLDITADLDNGETPM